MDDGELARAMRVGDQAAFRIFVEREAPATLRVCYRILGRLDDAEDAAQESFVIAARSIGGYRAEGALGAWLSRIAMRESFRRLRSRRPVLSLDPADESLIEGSAGADPLATLLTAERIAAVRTAVANLPEPYREIVALRFFAERSLDEMAIVTGRPIGTLKSQLHRGLARLRNTLIHEAQT